MARIRIIEPAAAQGELADIYEELASSRGKLAEVHKIGSLNPASIRDHMNLYMTVMFSHSPLSRAEREMMAVVVSAANECAYCVAHHGDALNHYWRNHDRVSRLAAEGAGLHDLSDRERSLCSYAALVTREPRSLEAVTMHARLRAGGLDDRAILDATLVASYFNFVNRIVLALGVELENEAGGYRYD